MSRTFGSYRVLDELGSGALSTVYRAAQEPIGRVVAIKALKSTIAPSSPFAAQLEREARVLSLLNHPNVVLLHDFVKTPRDMYLVLEHVDGFTLASVLGKRARFSSEFVAAIGLEIARGLAHAHERGVVHRDVKPHNVLLSKHGEVKLVDFGIAQRERLPSADEPLLTPLRAAKSEAESAFGTPAYMSPEQILGETVDARSDVFSLGVVLYQMLAGVRPFDREGDGDRRAAAHRIRRDPARPLRERAPDVPRALERVVMRSLEKLPADRFANAEDLVERLDAFLRTRGSPHTSSLIVRTLHIAGLVEGEASTERRVVDERPRTPLSRVMAGFAAVTLLFAVGGGVLQWSARGARAAAQAAGRKLDLVPASAGGLRVVAHPWAEVVVDGQRVDVTPMARAIPLSPGLHYVTLTHPNARPEKHAVTIAPGETTSLDVTMNLEDAPGAPDAGAAQARNAGDGGP